MSRLHRTRQTDEGQAVSGWALLIFGVAFAVWLVFSDKAHR